VKDGRGAEIKEELSEDFGEEADEGKPKPVPLKVNASYPEGNPLPTVPATLLAALPTLPPDVRVSHHRQEPDSPGRRRQHHRRLHSARDSLEEGAIMRRCVVALIVVLAGAIATAQDLRLPNQSGASSSLSLAIPAPATSTRLPSRSKSPRFAVSFSSRL
jgi:hypothetical protein